MSPLWLGLITATGIIAGWLAGRVMRGRAFGLLADLIAGIAGAFAGGWLFRPGAELSIDLAGSLIAGFLAAMVLLFALRLLTGQRPGRR